MKQAIANCAHCGKQFEYIKIYKPVLYCSQPCNRRRTQQLQNERRRAQKQRHALREVRQ